ncbi:hypothetical protein L6654_06530 [Bradyrhizobium sp. WYCCWR 13023]|uniref:Uncharacterized protein n=1 Tax=Bradyrhizobium zhengyangense TaxID=2911009 RepID=A0A9X1U8D1_9BRAD|nr:MULTISPECIES: hypothetical protein [Bradyrhizobium]MCG2626279.1 hypothetical protein [Bradyrhizobium zhengyangense]MCG2644709.1 hypothetical protein [Bradyrhizobium zhengyangense]MCG2668287.1 hypothetical protein [Bradyrhizobium zhengyangense]
MARWLNLRSLVLIATLAGLLLFSCVVAYLGWTSTDALVPASGYVAMAIGVGFSLVLGVGLMALVFYSSRHGYDEPAHRLNEDDLPER